jgi:cobalt-factor III methyltransferase
VSGKLNLVSVGPGFTSLIPDLAREALKESDVVVGYDLYLRWIAPWIEGKEQHTPPLTQERERARLALEFARAGRTVSLVSSGDIGIYAMATLAFDELLPTDTLELRVVPGISAANACASLLGAPLSHDYATLSLSDLLCPWEWIEKRASHIAQADLCAVFYNVQSRGRQEGVYKILDLMLEHKAPETVCGVVRNAYREDQTVSITTLEQLRHQKFDMLTSLVIGNRFTACKTQPGGREWMFTPRGYHAWAPEPEARAAEPTPPQGAVWVFAGTADGNALARSLIQAGETVVLSVASEYGGEVAANAVPGAFVYAGRRGVEARRQILTGAKAIVDATHPYAAVISPQLAGLGQELGVPYLRYERPGALKEGMDGVTFMDSIEEAVQAAQQAGERVFLATGSGGLKAFTTFSSAVQFFARVAPIASSLDAAHSAGIPTRNLLAMLGPFSVEQNVSQWRHWGIQAVISKDSGEAGGATSKLQAARELGIPLIVLRRPRLNLPNAHGRPEDVLDAVKNIEVPV